MWASLDADLLRAIAFASSSATTLASMQATCRSWRVALEENDALWQEFAHARFPRLRTILLCTGPTSLSFKQVGAQVRR